MVQFWLDNLQELVNTQNFNLNVPEPEKTIRMLNAVALASLVLGIIFSYTKKNAKYFGIGVVAMSVTILIHSNAKASFSSVNPVLDSAFDTGAYLVKNAESTKDKLNNTLVVNEALNFNTGDVIALSNNNTILEVNIVSGVKYTPDGLPVIVLLKPLKGNYSKYTTKILKVSDNAPAIVPPPDGNISIQSAGTGNNISSDPLVLSMQNYPKFGLPNQNRFDWNLEQSSMVAGTPATYNYQGQPNGNLKCRESTVENPMGTINVTEYNAPPTMYGTCNVGESTDGVLNDTLMTRNQEATVSQSVNDLLFHKGNSQTVYGPMPIDTMPDNQAAFANFCYNSPTNMINVKYGSIFVNDPEKYKLVSKLTRATGTENGGGR